MRSLGALRCRDIAVMDSFAVHQDPEVAVLAKAMAVEVRLLLPAPDINPIE